MNALDFPAGLVRGTPGVYRFARPPKDLARRLASHGWTTGVLDRVGNKKVILEGIGEALAFGDYYGANLDALYDCLTDITRPTALIWQGWQDFAVYHADDWAKLRHVFGERMCSEPPFAVVLI